MERLEYIGNLFLAHADAAIAHFETEPTGSVALVEHGDPNNDCAARGEFNGVAGEIDQHLTEAQRIAA